MTNLTYKFGNNFENEFSSVAVSVPALIEGEGQRGAVQAKYIELGEPYVAFSVPANSVIKNFYLVVEDPMAGDVTVNLGQGGTELFGATAGGDVITATGIAKSIVEDVYVTADTEIEFIFSHDQTSGSIKLAFDFIQLDTNTAKYNGR